MWIQNAISLGVGSSRLLLNNADLGGLKQITAVMKSNKIMRDASRKFEKDERGKELLATMYGMDKEGDKYWPKVYNLKTYENMPENSFGKEYFKFMNWNGFEPHPRSKAEPAIVGDTTSYIYTRYRQTHDFYHVLLGLGPSPSEEIGVHAFGLAQGRTPPSVLIVSGGVMQSMALGKALELCLKMKYISFYYALGLKAKPVVFNKWEDIAASGISLQDLRKEMGLEVLNRRKSIARTKQSSALVYENIKFDPTDECLAEMK